MELRPYRRKFEVLARIARTARTAVIADRWMRDIVADSISLLNADRGTLYWLDPENGELWSVIEADNSRFTIRLKVGQGLAGWVAMAGVPLLINDVLMDDRFDARWDKKSGYRTQTVLATPMLDADGQVIGVLQMLNSARGAFDEEDALLITAIAEVCALAELARRSALVEA
ncbi:MAG: GAF domain-containing protein [Proteobacteria bacterium]|nr:GAF domain-containing protein [Pseudomonadota bacterium]